MGILGRLPVFMLIIVTDAILFLFYSRVVLRVLDVGKSVAGTGPATSAMELLPQAMQLVMGIVLIGGVGYLLLGIGEERAATARRRMR